MNKNNIKYMRLKFKIRNKLMEIIYKNVKDPRINSMITITAIEIKAKFKIFNIYISIFDNDKNIKNTIIGLNSANNYIKTKLIQKINLKGKIKIKFILDKSIEHGILISKLVNNIHKK